jgi:hypothetical protein
MSSYSILVVLASQGEVLLLRYRPRRPVYVRVNKVISAHSDLGLCAVVCFGIAKQVKGTPNDLIPRNDKVALELGFRSTACKIGCGQIRAGSHGRQSLEVVQ